MDRICRLDPFLVVRVVALGRKLDMLSSIKVSKSPCNHITFLELRGLRHRLEQPATHDLEPFFGAGRTPGRFHAANHIAQSVKRFAPTLTTNFDIIGPGMWRPSGV